ncbi:MAG TPA: hypothetical protein VFC86_06610, partial [Planctomycetota bacterium]|nr:hypothetical protein [Planctomycetota bacterium]
MLRFMNREVLPVVAAVVVLAFSAFWMACGSSGGDSGGGGINPPAPPPLPTSPLGWTELAPSADTLTIYVSSSTGNNTNDGLSPATPKATINAGKALVRDGMPDWLLLKAGDTWTGQGLGDWTKSGRSASEPIVIGSYGTGARPLIRTGTSDGVSMFDPVSHVVIVGLHFIAHTYDGSQDTCGMRLLGTLDDILVEDCFVQGYSDNIIVIAVNGAGSLTNFRLRRCVIADSYSDAAHSQGIYTEGVDGLLIEECVFDHNGWKEGAGGSPATIFNHNTYINATSNVVLRGNMFLRASSIGNKFNADNSGDSQNSLVENNFYIEGEVAISAGGNTNDALRFVDFTIRNNVMMHIGRTQPTNRDLAWYVDVQDWDGGSIEDNLFLRQPDVSNSFSINLAGSTERQMTISGNLFYGVRGENLIFDVAGSETGILVQGNEFQDPVEGSHLVVHSGSFNPATYQGNSYFSSAAAGSWFGVNGTNRSFAQWVTASGETGATSGAVAYPDPSRDEVTYQVSLGGTATFAAFIAEARLQSKANWRPAYTADGINDYIRAGFGR